jgi:hypothetical protein
VLNGQALDPQRKVPGPKPIPDAPPTPPDSDSPQTPKKPKGAPRVFDQNLRELYCELLVRGFAKGDAARLLGITRKTVSEARQDPKFDRDVLAAVLDCRSRAAAQIVRAGNNHWRAAAWLLTSKVRKRPAGRPREIRSLLLDKRLHSQIKDLIRTVLDELLPGDPSSLAETIQTARQTPVRSAWMEVLDDRQRILAKTITVIKSLIADEAAHARIQTRENSTCAQNGKQFQTARPDQTAEVPAPTADAQSSARSPN